MTIDLGDEVKGVCVGYVESNLMPGESVVYAAKLHWFMLVAPATTCVCGLVIVVLSEFGSGPPWSYFGIIGSLALLFGAVAMMVRFLTMRSVELAVTSNRVMFKVGVIGRRTREIGLGQVETVGVDQGMIGRMFGFGRVTIVGTGGTKEPIAHVAAPLEFRRHVLLELAR